MAWALSANDTEPDTLDTVTLNTLTSSTGGTAVQFGDAFFTDDATPGGSFDYNVTDGHVTSSNEATATIVNNATNASALVGTSGDDSLVGGDGNDTIIFAKELAFAHELAPGKSAEREYEAKIGEKDRASQQEAEPGKKVSEEARIPDIEAPDPTIQVGRRFMPSDPVEMVRRFLRDLGINPDLPSDELQYRLGRLMENECDRIAENRNNTERVRGFARLMRSFMRPIDTLPLEATEENEAAGRRSPPGWLSRPIPVEFSINPREYSRGDYDPITRRVTLNLASIARSLDVYWRGGATPQQFLRSLIGTAVHETLVHGLQRTDAVPWTQGMPRRYTGLHEIEALMVQRLFDPTLGEKDAWGEYRSNRGALRWIVHRVLTDYVDPRQTADGRPLPSRIDAVRLDDCGNEMHCAPFQSPSAGAGVSDGVRTGAAERPALGGSGE